MPQAVIPFKQDPKSFILAILVIMVLVRLLFVLISALPRRPWWWNKITTWMRMMHRTEGANRRRVMNNYRRSLIWNGDRSPERTTDLVEFETLEV